MFVTITGSDFHWTVHAPGRLYSGFGSARWAYLFAETLGFIVWDDPDVDQQ